jgi:FkbM family methyltransferase
MSTTNQKSPSTRSRLANLRDGVLKRILNSDDRLREVERILHRVEHDPDFRSKVNPPWWIDNASEPNVALHLRELLRPGDVALDVGANVGQLTQIMSRAVGPRGLVVAFEANEATLPELTNNLVRNVHTNCWPIFAAVMRQSGKWLSIEDHGAASVVVESAEGTHGSVPSLAIDDFVKAHNLAVALIKLDIEGNEIQALDGAWSCIDRDLPIVIFEHNMGKDAPLTALQAHGYAVFCCSQHTRIRKSADCFPGTSQRNLIAIHQERLGSTRFFSQPTRRTIIDIIGSDIQRIPATEDTASVTFGVTLKLLRGRYLLTVEADAADQATLYIRARATGMTRQHWTSARHFLRNERDMVFDLAYDDTVSIEFAEISSNISLIPQRFLLECLEF